MELSRKDKAIIELQKLNIELSHDNIENIKDVYILKLFLDAEIYDVLWKIVNCVNTNTLDVFDILLESEKVCINNILKITVNQINRVLYKNCPDIKAKNIELIKYLVQLGGEIRSIYIKPNFDDIQPIYNYNGTIEDFLESL